MRRSDFKGTTGIFKQEIIAIKSIINAVMNNAKIN